MELKECKIQRMQHSDGGDEASIDGGALKLNKDDRRWSYSLRPSCKIFDTCCISLWKKKKNWRVCVCDSYLYSFITWDLIKIHKLAKKNNNNQKTKKSDPGCLIDSQCRDAILCAYADDWISWKLYILIVLRFGDIFLFNSWQPRAQSAHTFFFFGLSQFYFIPVFIVLFFFS